MTTGGEESAGGGGYVDLQLGKNGTKLSRFEASMEFGATVAIDFVIASAEVHALGGVRFVTQDTAGGETIMLDAFIRIGGSVEVFGLISVSIELLVLLSYQADHNRLVGHATLVIDVDLTLFSESVTLDSGDWVLVGSSTLRLRNAAAAGVSDNSLAGLVEYFGAFAP